MRGLSRAVGKLRLTLEQREWIQGRNSVIMQRTLHALPSLRGRVLFAVLFIARISPIASAQTADLMKPLTLSQLWSLDSTYTDQQHGITFRYPSVWKPATQFGYVPPALTSASGPYENQIPSRVTGFGYSAGGFPRRIAGPYTATNLEGFGFIYSVLGVASKAECDKKAAYVARNADTSRPKLPPVRIAGRSYSVFQIAGEAMNQTYTGKLYGTYNANACYLIETGVATVLPAVVSEIQIRALTAAQLHDIDVRLWHMVETVRIVQKR